MCAKHDPISCQNTKNMYTNKEHLTLTLLNSAANEKTKNRNLLSYKMTPHTQVDMNRCFKGMYFIYLQAR
jgi:hypothetical protein